LLQKVLGKWAHLGEHDTPDGYFANQMGVTWLIFYFRGLFCEPNGRNLANAPFLKAVLRTKWAQLGDQTTSQGYFANQMAATW
jgi:hypothetical protein